MNFLLCLIFYSLSNLYLEISVPNDRFRPSSLSLIHIYDEGETVRVLMKTKKETIRELLFVCTGKEDCTRVQINGKFTKDDINKLVNQETGKKHGHLSLIHISDSFIRMLYFWGKHMVVTVR